MADAKDIAELIVITPSRGRAARLREMVEAVHSTALGDVAVVAGLDHDDPALPDYEADAPYRYVVGPRQSLCAWTNTLALAALASNTEAPPRYLASLGDDHRPRTKGWDRKLIEAIEAMDGPGFAYGRDLFQDKNMPTAWVVSAEIVRAVGWMMLPCCAHMYVDAAVLELGRAAGRIAYRPDVIVEHVHPLAGKASWDASYRESNSEDRYEVDRMAYDAWRANQFGRFTIETAAVAALKHEGRVTS